MEHREVKQLGRGEAGFKRGHPRSRASALNHRTIADVDDDNNR